MLIIDNPGITSYEITGKLGPGSGAALGRLFNLKLVRSEWSKESNGRRTRWYVVPQ